MTGPGSLSAPLVPSWPNRASAEPIRKLSIATAPSGLNLSAEPYHANRTDAASSFADVNLGAHALLKGFYVGDDALHFARALQHFQRREGHVQRLGVEG